MGALCSVPDCDRAGAAQGSSEDSLAASNASSAPAVLDLIVKGCLLSYSDQYAGLSLLSVVCGGKLTLNGSAVAKQLQKSSFFEPVPEITWSKADVPRATVLMVDLGPGDSAPTGMPFPIVHSIWTDCSDGNLSSGTAIKPYMRPGCTWDPPNRYSFILFKQSADLTFAGQPATQRAKEYAENTAKGLGFMDLMKPYFMFDAGKFLAENEGLKPIAANFVIVGAPSPIKNFIVSAEAHFHPFQVGAPRPEEAHKKIDAFCDKFAAGLANPKDDALLNLFADDGVWADPVGGPPPFVGKAKLAERITKLPAMDFAKVVEVFYTVSDKIFMCKTEVKFTDKPKSFIILDKFVVDDDFKIKSAEAHFHPFQVGAPRPEEAHTAIDMYCDQFAKGLANPKDDALLNLFTDNGTWADPVGGPPPFVGREKLAERITKLPPMDYAKVVEVFYTVSDKICLCKTEVKFTDKPKSFFIIDKFVIQ